MTKKNEQIAARKPLRRRSWLARLLRDERGNASGTAEGVVLLAGGIAISSFVGSKVYTVGGQAADTVMTNLTTAVAGKSGGQTQPNFNTTSPAPPAVDNSYE